MKSRMMTLMDEAGDRPIVGELAAAVRRYASSLPERLQLAIVLQQQEEAIGEATLARVQRLRPSFASDYANAWDKGLDDFALVGRTCAQAILLDRLEELDERLLDWQVDMYAQFGFPQDFVTACYASLWEETRRRLNPAQVALAEPFYAHVIERLSALQPAK